MKLRTLSPRLAKAPSIGPKPAPASIIERKRGSVGMRDRSRVWARDLGLCQECKRQGYTRRGHAVDHIIPLHLMGTDQDDNKQVLCKPCHDAKSADEAKQRGASWQG